MISQYPHTITITEITTDSNQDASGDFVQGTTATRTINCRYETNDGNGYVSTDSGERVEFSAIVYMKLPVNVIDTGAAVVIKDNGTEIASGTVKHFHRGQLNARVWL